MAKKATAKKSRNTTVKKPATAKNNGKAKANGNAKKTPPIENNGIAGKTIGQRIAAGRSARGWSQVELAGKCGLSQGHICDLERERKRPSVETLQAVAKALGVTAGVLLGESA